MQQLEEKLYLRFHGRIIDSLGIQMYQSPVAAVAELIRGMGHDGVPPRVRLYPNQVLRLGGPL